jgi:predicted benzoate:H+ symporter BenE
MSVFVTGYVSLINWAVLNIGRSIALTMAAAAFVEFVLVGLVIGLVYKPALSSGHRDR